MDAVVPTPVPRAALRRAGLMLLVAFGLTACTASSPPRPRVLGAAVTPATLQPAVAHRLYFGRAMAGGILVSEAEWEVFLNEVVGNHFPEGFTVWRADGRWEQEGGVLREPSFVLEVIRPLTSPGDSAAAFIAREYRERFRQEAVLWVREEVLMSIERQ